MGMSQNVSVDIQSRKHARVPESVDPSTHHKAYRDALRRSRSDPSAPAPRQKRSSSAKPISPRKRISSNSTLFNNYKGGQWARINNNYKGDAYKIDQIVEVYDETKEGVAVAGDGPDPDIKYKSPDPNNKRRTYRRLPRDNLDLMTC